MTRLIIKNGYLRNSQKLNSHKAHLIKYIATRDGVEFSTVKNKKESKNQSKLIAEIIKDFPVSKLSFEYADYKNNPTAENASDFISVTLEQHLDKIGDRKRYLDYISNRPRVEKISTHGLFNGTEKEIVLSQVAKEISEHSGNIWTPIISLHREDAHATGYENAHEWQALLSEKALKIAECLKIHPDNFRWYGAFHNESHHPHVHMICYSVNPNEGYLTKQGIEKMKSALQTEIFKAELAPLYAEKTKQRDELKKEVQKSFVELKLKLQTANYTNPQLEDLILQLSEKLKTHKGKKQFGYLQAHAKNIVNAIVDELAKEPNIKEAYNLWQDLQEEIYHGYKDTLPPRLKLSEQKEFKSIKNMIISEVLKLNFTENILQEEVQNNTKIGFTIANLLKSLANIFEDNKPQDNTTTHQKIDSKAMRKLRELKASKGQKHTGEDLENTYQQTM